MTNEPESVAGARELMRSFRQVYRTMTQLMRTQADTVGLTPVQMMVVRTLAEESNLSLSELADRIQLGCSTVSGVVKRLVECEVVERDRLDEDQRTVAIRLTEKGRQIDNQVFDDHSLMSQLLDRFLQFPKQDIQTLLKLHQELIHILNAEIRE
ncbi:MAG: MarR family transcriptional regulator [Bacilli bacterium]|nr:MarR family transcriptional regulator [Bacilli bacterium]